MVSQGLCLLLYKTGFLGAKWERLGRPLDVKHTSKPYLVPFPVVPSFSFHFLTHLWKARLLVQTLVQPLLLYGATYTAQCFNFRVGIIRMYQPWGCVGI